jgi:hypothetical protein
MNAAFLGIGALAIVVAGSLPAGAHHRKNPHVLIDLTTNDGKPDRAEWTSAAILNQTSVEPPKACGRR